MKISEIFKKNKPTLSFEVFPPKTSDGYESVKTATEKIAELKPSFMSVTYGAGGTTKGYTVSIAENIQKKYGIPALSHLTCVSVTKDDMKNIACELKNAGIENILALRGDMPKDMTTLKTDYKYACELVSDIKKLGDFCVGGACYPEGHIEANNFHEDIEHLKIKADSGCDFLTTQMFFDNNIMYNFLYRAQKEGINIPIVAGIMPVTNVKQVERSCALSGTYLPRRFKMIVDRFGDNPESMAKAGIAYATEQIIDLIANGVDFIHVYSMNKPEIAEKINENLKGII